MIETAQSGDMDRLRREWASVLDGEYAGLRVETDVVDREPNGTIAVARVYDSSGEKVGDIARLVTTDDNGVIFAQHAMMTLEPHVRGQGFAREFNGHLERWYRSAGVDRIELEANIDVGGYAWARQGYDFADPLSAQRIMSRLETAAGQLERGRAEQLGIPTDRVGDQIAAADAILERARSTPFGDPDFPSAYEVSQAGRWQGATTWIGKATLLGSSWNGVKPL